MLKGSAIFLLIFIGASAYAQTDTTLQVKKIKPVPPWWVERFSVSAGVFYPLNHTSIKVGSENGSFGTTVDFEDDLGFDQTTVTFLARLHWRASLRSIVEFDYYYISRNSTTTLKKEIEFKDVVYTANSVIKASSSTAIYRITYGYAIFLHPRYEAGLSIGTHILGVKVDLSTSVNGGSNTQADYNVTAPLPDIGAWGNYTLSEQWAVNGTFNYFSVTIDNVDGRILSYHAGVTYKVLKKLTAKLGYTGLNFKVNVTKDHYKTNLRWGCNGPNLTVNFAFGKNKWRQ